MQYRRFALTIFVGAFLLFQVQPMMARFILPWFGGGPAVWSVCLLFFQALLLVGYLYAHWLGSRPSVRFHGEGVLQRAWFQVGERGKSEHESAY